MFKCVGCECGCSWAQGFGITMTMWCCVCVCCAEASYTLLLYDELLEWSDRPLREFLNYPMQSEWQRKEYLHLTIVQNFDRGKVGSLSL